MNYRNRLVFSIKKRFTLKMPAIPTYTKFKKRQLKSETYSSNSNMAVTKSIQRLKLVIASFMILQLNFNKSKQKVQL